MFDNQVAECATRPLGLSVSKPTILEQLRGREEGLKFELAKVSKAIETMSANPEIVTVLEAMNGVRFY